MTVVSDADFASAIASYSAAGSKQFLMAANGYQCRLYNRAGTSATWDDLGLADIDKQSVAALKPIARSNNLFWADVSGPILGFDPTVAAIIVATYSHISDWCKERDQVTKGRAGEVDDKTQFEVASLAAWRCQFDGCGLDLRTHFAGGKRGNYSYFAHIVASSPKGPRGDINLSRIRANDPSNIMLLCDKCHRLIDRVDPQRYDARTLSDMREKNIREVNRLLNSLQFPAAHMIVVGGNIEGQVAGFNAEAAENAMWSRKLRRAKPEPLVFMRNGSHLANSGHQHYWETLFESLRKELPALENYLSGTSLTNSLPPVVAVFPTHVTSIQILAGRVLGNSTTTHLFQPNRNASPTALGERWQWPHSAPEPASNKYSVKELVGHNGGKEAALLVYLTAALDRAELPGRINSRIFPHWNYEPSNVRTM
ncbi:MAG: SAVED domain-containing protein [Betaproteobacteria bacterium]|nr:SAVED domain-containing protein [Betaproteobacteria bacterium]